MKSPVFEKQMEEAITFLVYAIHKSGKNPKPVILHSIRVGLHLYNLGYDKDIIITGILHDVIEDTKTTTNDIKSKFSKGIAILVEANSFDKRISDKIESYKENFKRCHKAGKNALIVKAADIFDNADYCCFDEDGQINDWWVEKMKYFIKISKDILKHEVLYKELVKKYKRIPKH
jgi:guanosine-3',5'-bis(diphosphate) 3'-pyrophosphohydrolase